MAAALALLLLVVSASALPQDRVKRDDSSDEPVIVELAEKHMANTGMSMHDALIDMASKDWDFFLELADNDMEMAAQGGISLNPMLGHLAMHQPLDMQKWCFSMCAEDAGDCPQGAASDLTVRTDSCRLCTLECATCMGIKAHLMLTMPELFDDGDGPEGKDPADVEAFMAKVMEDPTNPLASAILTKQALGLEDKCKAIKEKHMMEKKMADE